MEAELVAQALFKHAHSFTLPCLRASGTCTSDSESEVDMPRCRGHLAKSGGPCRHCGISAVSLLQMDILHVTRSQSRKARTAGILSYAFFISLVSDLLLACMLLRWRLYVFRLSLNRLKRRCYMSISINSWIQGGLIDWWEYHLRVQISKYSYLGTTVVMHSWRQIHSYIIIPEVESKSPKVGSDVKYSKDCFGQTIH